MSAFNLANTKGRDAIVRSQGVRKTLKVRWLDPEGRQATHVRLIRSTIPHDVPALTELAGGLENLSELLIHSDPEVDIESFGRLLRDTARVYVDPRGETVNQVRHIEVLRNPDGTERERRRRKVVRGNVNTEEPIRLSGRTMKKNEVFNRFVFSGKRQLVHVNGLTYDFLFAIAKDLEESGSLMVVGSGPRGTNPIVLGLGGTPYRGFLEGRTQGDRYCLLLHLSNMELKAPPRAATPAAGTEATQ
ncbi:MAG: hypothetical protein K0Q72_316 [Armatimonadetes bacterium]|jgi:hypothetical protein|nr:hypothetical protein [Armatimonadota bacterium]